MTFRIATTVLGKRGLNEVSPAVHFVGKHLRPRVSVRQFQASSCHCQEKAQSRDDKRGSEDSTATSSGSNEAAKLFETESNRAKLNDWEDNLNQDIQKFSELPDKTFGHNQHILISQDFKEALRQILWQFKAPIRYAFAYGSGVFPQSAKVNTGASLHPSPPEAITKVQGGNQKMIDFIFGVSYSQHWHSLNLQEHRDHYSGLGYLGSYAVSKIQDSIGAGVYFNPYVTVNGTLIKYGVVNLDTLCRDLAEWDSIYLAGRLMKPVKILRDNPSVRICQQKSLLSAIRVALLLLPENFTERELYSTIAGLSYRGDPRMSIGGDDPRKVSNIVKYQLDNFRHIYAPLIDNLPNIAFNDPVCKNPDWLDDPNVNAKLTQSMDPATRGHMVRRLPSAFRSKLYFEYQSKFKIPRREFNEMMEQTKDEDPERIRRREGGPFEQRIASDEGLSVEVGQAIAKTVRASSLTQSIKGVLTAGVARSWRYATEKRAKSKAGKSQENDEAQLKQEQQEKKEKAEATKTKEDVKKDE